MLAVEVGLPLVGFVFVSYLARSRPSKVGIEVSTSTVIYVPGLGVVRCHLKSSFL